MALECVSWETWRRDAQKGSEIRENLDYAADAFRGGDVCGGGETDRCVHTSKITSQAVSPAKAHVRHLLPQALCSLYRTAADSCIGRVPSNSEIL